MKCNNKTGTVCRSDPEIMDWLQQKFIIVLTNRIRFDQSAYTDGSVIKESALTYIPIDTQLRQEIAHLVTIKDIEVQDNILINLKHLTQMATRAFSIEQHTKRPYEYPNDVHIAVTYSLSPDRILIKRQVYNVVDMLTEIGGLQYALFIILSFLLMLFNFNKMDNYLVSEMFQVIDAKTYSKKPKRVGFKNGKVNIEEEKDLHPKKLNWCREVIYGFILRGRDAEKVFPCDFMHRNRMERLFEKGRSQLNQQIDIA